MAAAGQHRYHRAVSRFWQGLAGGSVQSWVVRQHVGVAVRRRVGLSLRGRAPCRRPRRTYGRTLRHARAHVVDERNGNDDDRRGDVHRPRRVVAGARHHDGDRDDRVERPRRDLPPARRHQISRTDVQPVRRKRVPGGDHSAGGIRAGAAELHRVNIGPDAVAVAGDIPDPDVDRALRGFSRHADAPPHGLFRVPRSPTPRW